ncbi:hypothetical protein C446_10045 [Halobiforma nitratireducens JCM 10879]|uniref:Uncharacterized protein n=1 Tax=Halobiforma nitratireducens JCM 10879 TaxID=1227454 RepID=M0LZH1_9EURY|nr:hypothetical protein C446_10045 [Halobiforma nitratireducens JCM 10879]
MVVLATSVEGLKPPVCRLTARTRLEAAVRLEPALDTEQRVNGTFRLYNYNDLHTDRRSVWRAGTH